ncbi:MAG: malto-oligosyltrehalose trehalohydrolase [Syntrophobacteraceae bacterium]
MSFHPNIGAIYLGNGWSRFRTWAPFRRKVEVRLIGFGRTIPLQMEDRGYWSAEIDGVQPGERYFIRLDGELERPDPASFFQPEGVHGPSEVLDLDFDWHDQRWSGPALRDYIFYEAHVGTFTPDGTFEAMIAKLDYLAGLGISSLEIMPVAQFPGERNWGYDGVYPFAVQNSYGGPNGLRRLVDACHQKAISVTLDVVYNHFGPEGNYLRDFGPYFTQKYKTPWGEALNFDDEYCDEVRNFFIQNAIFWFNIFHVDALRLDAVHAICDGSAVPFLAQLAQQATEYRTRTGRNGYLIAESDLNDSRLIRPRGVWGYELDSQWSDDLHHALHVLLTGEREGYYLDFGKVDDLVKAIKEGYVYSGRYSEFRKKSHGNLSTDLPSERFVIASQNHDQVGNRMLGERHSTLVSFEAQKTAAAVILLSPFIPLLFMGQEYGEEAPFLYFISHSDAELVQAVRLGRSQEFKEFSWAGVPPDPDSVDTFLRSRLNWDNVSQEPYRQLLGFSRELIRMRRDNPALRNTDRNGMEMKGFEESKLMLMKRTSERYTLISIFNFDSVEHVLEAREAGLDGSFVKFLDSSDAVWAGPGSLLPEKVDAAQSLRLRPSSVAIFSNG